MEDTDTKHLKGWRKREKRERGEEIKKEKKREKFHLKKERKTTEM